MHIGQAYSTHASPRLRLMNWIADPIVRGILRSTLYGILTHKELLMTYTGKKSGRAFTLAVEYVTDGEVIYILVGSPDQKTWWCNLRGGAQVKLLVRRHPFTAHAEIVRGNTDVVIRGLQAYFNRFPASATARGIQRSADGVFARDDLEQAATSAIMVRLTGMKPV